MKNVFNLYMLGIALSSISLKLFLPIERFCSPGSGTSIPVISVVFLMLPGTFSFKQACTKIGFRIRASRISLIL